MKPLKSLTKEDIANIKYIIFDCDGVTCEKGTELKETRTELYIKTKDINDRMVEKLNRLKKHFTVGFSSGRSLMYLDKVYNKVIDDKVILQGENGILMLLDGVLEQNRMFSKREMATIRKFKRFVATIDDPNICGFEPKQFLITIHCKDRVPDIESNVPNEFYCLWNGEAYDIGIKGIDKGFGIRALKDISDGGVIAIGNGENDKPMLDQADIGITTDRSVVESDYYTELDLDLGGEELIDHLLKLMEG